MGRSLCIRGLAPDYRLCLRDYSGYDRPDYSTICRLSPEEAYALACTRMVNGWDEKDPKPASSVERSEILFLEASGDQHWRLVIELPPLPGLRGQRMRTTIPDFEYRKLTPVQRYNLCRNTGARMPDDPGLKEVRGMLEIARLLPSD